MIESQLAVLEPYVRTVTTILMHSLWQGMLVGILAAVALSLLRRSSVRIRYVVSCAAMGAVIVAAAVTVVLVWPDGHSPTTGVSAVTNELPSGEGSSDVGATTNISASASDVSSSSRWWQHPSISRYFFMIWVAGVMLLSVYHLLGWRRARRFARRGTSPVPPEWRARFERWCDEFRVGRLVSILNSSLVKVPCVVGWMKPVILVPVSMFTCLDPSEIEMILLHELAHVRRYDVLINMIQTAVETLFFFNPAIWWLSRQIRIEREDCCDDTAILRTGDRLKYARALANLEELRMFQTSFGSAITGTPLRRRIQRIVGATRPRLYSSALSLSGLLFIISIIAAFVGSSGGLKSSAVQAGVTIEATQTFDPAPGDLRGEWEIESDREDLQIRLHHRGGWQSSFNLDRDKVFDKTGDGQKPFQIIYDAGTLFLDGEFERNGWKCWGEGEWYFRPDSNYMHFVSRYGLRGGDKEKALSLAVFDVSREFISRLERYSYLELDVDKLISARIHGVSPEFIAELQAAGYSDLSFDQLIAMRVHDVSAEDAREFETLGFRNLTIDDLIAAKVHDVSREFIDELRAAGYHNLTFDQLIAMRVHGVSAKDGRKFKKLGFRNLKTKIEATHTSDPGTGDLRGEWETEMDGDRLKILVYGRRSSGMSYVLAPDQVADLIGQGQRPFQIVRDAGTLFLEGSLRERHGEVDGSGNWYFRPDTAYVRFMSRYGFPENDRQKVLSFAIYDISREYLGELRDAGYADVPHDRLLSMRIQGVTADDAREFERLGCGHLTPDELISAKIHGITTGFVKSFRDAGFADLSYKSFVTLHAFNLNARAFEDCFRHRFMDMSQENMVWVCGFGITQKDIGKMQERGYTNLDTIIRILAEERGQ